MGTTITPTEERLLEGGTFPARLVSIVHQGTKVGQFGPQTQAIFKFIFPGEMQPGDKYVPSANVYVSVSYGQNAQFLTLLRKLGIDTTKQFDLEDAIGKECQVTCTVKDGYLNAKHKDVAPLVKGLVVPPYEFQTQFFWFTSDYFWETKTDEKGNPILDEDGEEQNIKTGCNNVTMIGFDCLNEKQIDKIVQSREYNWLQKNKKEEDDGSLPF